MGGSRIFLKDFPAPFFGGQKKIHIFTNYNVIEPKTSVMKKTITAMLLFFAAGMLVRAQAPTTTYPYLYPVFRQGVVVMDGGKRIDRQLNIHLRKAHLHYLENDIIKEAFLNDVIAVEVGDDVYIPVFDEMMKVVAKNDKGCVAAEILGNFEEAKEAKGAYGTSSATSATMKLTSVQADNVINQNHMNIFNSKREGTELDLVTKYYVVTPKFKTRATKKDIEAALPTDMMDGWKPWLKAHKIKWNEPQSLLQVLEFLNQ